MTNQASPVLRRMALRCVSLLARFGTLLARAETGAGILLLASLIAVLSLQVAGRNLPGLHFGWTEEISRFLFAWLAFIGVALAVQRNAHIAIRVFADRAGRRMRTVLSLMTRLLIVGLALIMLIYGLRLCLSTRMVSTVLRVPMWVPYASIPVAGALILVHGVNGILRDITHGPPQPQTESTS